MKAIKIAVEVEVMKFKDIESAEAISEWAKGKVKYNMSNIYNVGYMYIETLEGKMRADIGDYIIKGVNGEFYPCKPDIFHKTYDIIRED